MLKEIKRFDLKTHNCFWVYQNKTFTEEAKGGFLWSPQYTSDGKRNPGYEEMKNVKKGDIIFHSNSGAIVAISVAKCGCYAAPRPEGFEYWGVNGWRIDTQYYHLTRPFCTSNCGQNLYKIQPSNGPFCSDGRGKQQYLCRVNQPVFEYVMSEILERMTEERENALLKFIDVKLILVKKPEPIDEVEDGCKVDAILMNENKAVTLKIDTEMRPVHKNWIGKKVDDILEIPGTNLLYKIKAIYSSNN